MYVIETEYMVRNLHNDPGDPVIENHLGKVAVFDSTSGARGRHRTGFNVGLFDGHAQWWDR